MHRTRRFNLEKMKMIAIQHETTHYTVTEANAAKYRKIFDSGKWPKMKMPSSTPIRRDYPKFEPGMTTAHYVAAFNRQFDGVQIKIQHGCTNYHEAAPMLDPTMPEVVKEIDPDYIEPEKPIKRKAPSAAQYRKACMEALELLKSGDIDTAQCILAEVLK
jgi:hypothetical protein